MSRDTHIDQLNLQQEIDHKLGEGVVAEMPPTLVTVEPVSAIEVLLTVSIGPAVNEYYDFPAFHHTMRVHTTTSDALNRPDTTAKVFVEEYYDRGQLRGR